jgi:hypothetical protein
MNETILKFIISHLKKAIYNLECAKKLSQEELFEQDVLKELKLTLIELQIKLQEKKNNE